MLTKEEMEQIDKHIKACLKSGYNAPLPEHLREKWVAYERERIAQFNWGK